ncbi:MAG: flagellar hook-length control protein FliK [Sulfuricella sp.]|nr:flagellar hook-length control protein FliK [Sulfuricella sp.]
MIHNDVLNQLQLLIKTSAPPLIEVAQTPLEEAQWVPGQRLTAMVLASLPNGRFQVQVGDMALDMNLPRNTQPGDQVELTFVSNQPRLTFALTRDLPVAAGNNLAVDAKPQVTLSDSVRYLGALLQKISDQAETQAAPLNKTAPLLSAAPSDIKEFAVSLRNTLSQSGLFYESHQAQWVAGERKLTDLLREPQGRLSPNIASLAAAAAGTAPGKAQAAFLPESALIDSIQGAMTETGSGKSPSVSQPDRALIYSAQGGVAETGPRDAQTAARSGSALMGSAHNAPLPPQPESASMQGAGRLPVHAEAVALVQQQLQTLDSRQLVWQGQVWQGQPMEWRVEERNAREGGVGEVEMPHWQTSLRLQLPRLGDVQATLAFTPQGLRIDLKAADAGTAEAMRGAQDKLRSSMEASGLKVLAMSVDRHEKAG